MAVKVESPHRKTEDLILPTPRRCYRDSIHTSSIHWQLRALLSSPEPNVVYYPQGGDIIALNTITREREIVTSIPYPPRCLVVSGDWLCVGGEEGLFTFICLNEDTRSVQEAAADDRLPLDLDPSQRATSRESHSAARPPSRTPRPITAPVIVLGEEKQINNCITIWHPGEDASDGAYKSSVAVVSSNDRTVTFLQLNPYKTLERLVFPDAVNRSVLSPNGEILATICDDPFLYVHVRKPKSGNKKSKKEGNEKKDEVSCEWVLAERIMLESQFEADRTDMKGSFCVCFSRSGQYLAIATQYGVISVFDTQSIGTSPLPVEVFTSSRPGDRAGAVRAMEFCPGPFDLLAWTESNTRVGIADVRTAFLSRQLIIVDAFADSVERINLSYKRAELADIRSGSPTSAVTRDYLGIGDLPDGILDRTPTREDLAVLDASAFYRRQREAARMRSTREELREASSAAERASRNRWEETETSSSSGGHSGRYGDSRFLLGALGRLDLPSSLREFTNLDRTTTSLRSFINDRTQENERRNQGPQWEPRRRSSMLLASVENAMEQERIASGAPRTRTDTPSVLERLSLNPPSRSTPNGEAARTAVDIQLEALYRARASRDPPPDSTTRLRIEIEDEAGRDFAHRLREPWRPLEEIYRNGLSRRDENETRSSTVTETLGCCWSTDGKILYVAGNDGIYEYNVNIMGRKVFPSLVLR